jgi:hypothetical protein
LQPITIIVGARLSAELTATQKKRTCHDTSVEHNPGTSTAQIPNPIKDGMTVCVQAFASQQRTVRCHDTETSATEINRSHKNGAFSELA